MPLIEVGKKPPLLGQDRPVLVYSAYLGSIGMLVAAALKLDLTSYVDIFSSVTLCAFKRLRFLFRRGRVLSEPKLSLLRRRHVHLLREQAAGQAV